MSSPVITAWPSAEYVSWGVQAAAAGYIEDARVLVQQAITARDVFVLYWKLPVWAPLRADAEGNKILRSTGLLMVNVRSDRDDGC